jgi:amidase/aspartyl-tRNA(Asn)/glutamyl-tRNA(Gln) amidotransferase subunit A
MLEQLAQAVREGRVAPIDLVDESLRRIDEANGTLNAVVARRDDEVRAEAESHPRTGPLAGLPLLVKDMARCAGWSTTYGSTLYAGAPPDEFDDIVVARLRAAGAIVVGRSNTPAFGHAPFTTNAVFGPACNPWNVDRSPGGSSGGSAAALAAGLVPLATTSDGGGSVRIPSSACGLVGWKPTMGAVGRNVLPRWLEFSTQGAAGHSVEDVVLQAHVMMGTAPGDWVSVPSGTAEVDPTPPARVLACASFRSAVDPVIEAAFRSTIDALVESGVTVEWVDAPSSSADLMDWFVMATAELAQSLGEHRAQWGELEPSLRDMALFGEAVTAADYLAAQRRRHDVGARFDHLVGDDGVLLVPTLNVQSWPPEGPVPVWVGSVEDPTVATNTPELNATGHPAVSVPIGTDEVGVPFGMQIIGPRFRDGLALGLAQVVERIRPWPAVAPGYLPFDLDHVVG